MAEDGGDENELIHPLCVIIPEGLPIEGNHKTWRSNILVKKSVPMIHHEATRRIVEDADLSYVGRCPQNTVNLEVPEDHPGFKEGRCYHAVCETCGMRNLSLERVGFHMEITKLVLCCAHEEKRSRRGRMCILR